MSSQQIILDHDRWRKGIGGAPAGLAGEVDSFAYAELDLNLAHFSGTAFTGSSFTRTTFREARWTHCQFSHCTFGQCDFQGMAVDGCTFVCCTFNQAQLQGTTFSNTEFSHCTWNGMNFDQSRWQDLKVLECQGTAVHAKHLRGENVDFTGSHFEQLEFEDTLLNSMS